LEGAREKVGGKSLEGVKKLNCSALERGGESTFTIEKRNQSATNKGSEKNKEEGRK
jgi:hypothetical protein